MFRKKRDRCGFWREHFWSTIGCPDIWGKDSNGNHCKLGTNAYCYHCGKTKIIWWHRLITTLGEDAKVTNILEYGEGPYDG